MDPSLAEIRLGCSRRMYEILTDSESVDDLASVEVREYLANFISVCFNPNHLLFFGENANLQDMLTIIYFIQNHTQVFFDKVTARTEDSPSTPTFLGDGMDPDVSLDSEVVMGWENNVTSSTSPNATLPEFPVAGLPRVGHTELLILKYFLPILTSVGEYSKRLSSEAIGALITLGDVIFQLAPYSYHKNYLCHMLASLLYTSSIITQGASQTSASASGVSAIYDSVATMLGLIPDNITVHKVHVHPELAPHEALNYFIKLAMLTIRLVRSCHFCLPNAPGLILEALFDVFFETHNPLCLDMCSDLLQLGSPRIAPIPAMLDYFAEILHTVGSFLEVVKDQHPQGTALADADVPSRPDKAMLRLEYSLARILKDIVDILPASAHVMVRALSQFTSTVVLLSQVPPLTKALPDAVIHCILVVSHGSTAELGRVVGSIQHATPASQAIVLKYVANFSNLLPARASYAVPYQDPLFLFSDITGKPARKAANGKARFPKRPTVKTESILVEVEADESEERLRASQAQASFDSSAKQLIRTRGLGNSDKEIASAILSHLVYHSLHFLGPLYAGTLTSLKEAISVMEIGIKLLPKECYFRLHQIIGCCLSPVYSFLLAEQVQVTEPFYRELCTIATMFSYSASHLETWGDETKGCYRSLFLLFAVVWQATIQNTAKLELEVFEEEKLEKLLEASREDSTLLFGSSARALDLEFDALSSITLAGMVALLPDLDLDHDFYYAFLLSAIFYSIQKTSPEILQAHVWRIMPKALACAPFLVYLQHKNLLLLVKMMCQDEAISGEAKAVFITNFGKLICSTSASFASTGSVPRQLFPTGEVICLHCDGLDILALSGEAFLERLPMKDSQFPQPLEEFPIEAIGFLLEFAKGDVPSQRRLDVSLSLCRALVHVPLKCYAELDVLIPALCSLALDSQAEIRRIASATLLNLVSFEESEGKRIFLFNAVEFLLKSAKDDPSGFTLILILSRLTDIAKKSHPAALARIICCLAEYFYHDEKHMTSSIFSKLHDIAAAHKIQLKALFNPLWGNLVDYIINDLKNQGHFVSNLAKALQVTVSVLLKLSAPYVLPKVVIDRDLEMLKKLSRLIEFDIEKAGSEEEQIVNMCAEYLPPIMASVSLLGDADQPDTFTFLFRLFRSRPYFNSQHIFKSCSADLTLLLAIELGITDNDMHGGREPGNALAAVANFLPSEKPSKDGLEPVQHLLVKHFMYIISSFNSILSEYHYPQEYSMQIKALRALDIIIDIVGKHINIFIPQILSAVKSATYFTFLASVGIKICHTLLRKAGYVTCKPFVNQILAMFSECYTTLDEHDQNSISALFAQIYTASIAHDNFRVILLPDTVVEFKSLNQEFLKKLPKLDPVKRAEMFIRTFKVENFNVCVLALKDFHSFLTENKDTVATWVLKEPISPIVDQMISALVAVCERFVEMKNPELQYNVMLCFGILGAVDPDRLSPKKLDHQPGGPCYIYTKETCIKIASELIERYLVKLYAGTMVVKDQFFVAYAIQELMRFCDFNISNANSDYTNEIKPFSRIVWDRLPDPVVEMIRPLMATNYQISNPPVAETEHPIFSAELSFEAWVCRWTAFLIMEVDGDITRGLFSPCLKVASKYVEVAIFLLPHLILTVVLQNNAAVGRKISQEIHAVLQFSANQRNSVLLSKASQVLFSVLGHLSNWCSLIKEKITSKKMLRNGRARDCDALKDALDICQKFVQGIPNLLLAQAAHKTINYYHAVFYLEAYIREINANKETVTEKERNDIYTQLHDLYFQLDDIDGLRGVKSLFLVGNVQQQLREHEASKNWPAAQTCYEVLANTSLNPKACQQGITSCMKNMGSLDLATTHLAGLAAKLPSVDLVDDLQQALYEASWRLGKWDQILEEPIAGKPGLDRSLSQLLLAAKCQNSNMFSLHLEDGRQKLLSEFSGQISHSYARGYDAVVWVHMLDEAETFHRAWSFSTTAAEKMDILTSTESRWNSRLLATSPSFKIRENILNFQRVLVDAHCKSENQLDESLESRINEMRSRSIVQCAKFARKAAYFQTAYRSLLENLECDKPAVAMEMAKWHWSQGQSWTAIGILMKLLGTTAPDLMAGHCNTNTAFAFSESMEQSQARLKLVKWMMTTSACNQDVIAHEFRKLRKAQPKWEKCHFHATQFLFGLLAHKASGVASPSMVPGVAKLLEDTIKCGSACLGFSSKYVYQLLPRIVTQWIHCNIAFKKQSGDLQEANRQMLQMARERNEYIFLPVFSQVVSRLNADEQIVWPILNTILYRIMEKFPQQSLWALVGTSVSKEETRYTRYASLLSRFKSNPQFMTIAEEIRIFCESLREIANFAVPERTPIEEMENKISNFLSRFTESKPLSIIMPTQSALSFSLPNAMSADDSSKFTPFPNNPVTIKRILPTVKVMPSIMRPRLLRFLGSDNLSYQFLCKPKDDLRKDSRLVELFHFLNRMFRQDPEARRRQLHIRTFAVVPLDQQCGLVEWVNNIEVLRGCILAAYVYHGVKCLPSDKLTALLNPRLYKTREQRIQTFEKAILPEYPLVLHEWFLKHFPHPMKWFAARSAYAHTLAVMSMVGFVVGLGDRHGENILLDRATGDVVHVDFSSLFEVSIDLRIPELVPFRLTSNMVDALGITGYEGTFRKSCEVTMTILRANRETLKALLETFLHDPLADFLNKKKDKATDNPALASRAHFIKNIKLHLPYKNLDANSSVNNPDALWALDRISKKLDGKSSSFWPAPLGTDVQPISVEGQVLQLLQSATDSENLFCMYIGWGPYL